MQKQALFTKANAVIFLFCVMLTGLLFSRALLSISCACWILVIIFYCKKESWKLNKSLLLWSCAPIILFITGLYQQPIATANYDYLLSLLMYPLIFFAVLSVPELLEQFKKIWIVFAMVSLVYPLSVYAVDYLTVAVNYGKGQSLPTLMEHDHVRYGLFLIATLLLVVSLNKIRNSIRLILGLVLCTAIILMAVRTAWAGLLIIGVCLLFYKFPGKDFNKLKLLWLLPIIIIAWFVFPPVSQKIKYTIYDWQSYQASVYNPDFSDGARRTINAVAYQSIKDGHANVGWAAVPSTLLQAFEEKFPGQQLTFKWPFNQWLFWWTGSGFLGMILFTCWLFYPIIYGMRKKNFYMVAWSLVITASCLVESTLNFQFGIFLHAWVLAITLATKIQEQKVSLTYN